MRVKHIIQLWLADDAELKQKFFERDAALATVVLDGFERPTTGKMAVADAATESIPFGDVAVVRGLYLEADQPCTLRINSGTEAIPVEPGLAGELAKVFLETSLSAAEIEATGGAAVNLTYAVWGDPTP